MPLDPGRPCDRCGAFAPLAWRGGQLVCAGCRDRLRTTVETAPVSTASLLAGAFTLGARVGPRVAAVVVALQLPVAVATLPLVFVAATLYAKTRPEPQLSVHPA